MRPPIIALAAAALLAVAVPAAPASQILLPPAGQYLGSSPHVTFSLDLSDLHDTKVVHFAARGTTLFSHAKFHYGEGTYGWFDTRVGTYHVWGHWTAQYGHVFGGFAHTYHGRRYVTHWTAAADGF